MEDLNKVVSFILGLVVVVVFLAIISGRIKIGGRIGSIVSRQTTVTPTPTTKTIPTITYNKYSQTTGIPTAKTIPATGAPIIIFPILLSGAVSGFYLRRAGKKE